MKVYIAKDDGTLEVVSLDYANPNPDPNRLIDDIDNEDVQTYLENEGTLEDIGRRVVDDLRALLSQKG